MKIVGKLNSDASLKETGEISFSLIQYDVSVGVEEKRKVNRIIACSYSGALSILRYLKKGVMVQLDGKGGVHGYTYGDGHIGAVLTFDAFVVERLM